MLISEQNRLLVKPEETSQLLDLLKNRYREDTAIFCGVPPGFEANAEAESALAGRDNNVFIDCSALNQVREHVLSDMVLAVETGITMTELASLLAKYDQIFPVDVQDPNVRLIDIISSGDGGYLEQGFGYMRSLVLGLEVAYGGGKCAKLGGRVVKNVTGFDLTKLVVGGRGIFGVPYLAHLRLFAKPPEQLSFAVGKRSHADLLLLAAKLLASGLPLSGLELIESNSGGASAHQYALVIQVMGASSLVSAVAASIRQLAGDALNELSSEELALAHPVLVQPPSTYLEVSLSKASAAALIDHLASIGGRGSLRYRPGMGRLFLDCPDQATLEKAYKVVTDFLSNTKLKTGGNPLAEFEPGIISKSSGPYKFSSHCQRAGDATFGQLVGKLRRTFDPLRCFNIGVTFHDC
jgi:FAD/FMN-containing dehydrogenase